MKKTLIELNEDHIKEISMRLHENGGPVACDALAIQRARDLAMVGHTDHTIALLLGISSNQYITWLREREEFKKAVYAGRAVMIEGKQIELAQKREIKETVTKYRQEVDEKTGSIERVLVSEEEKIKEVEPDSKALDRLAGKYCQELAPKERKEVEHNVVFMIDTGVPQSVNEYVEAECRELVEQGAVDNTVDNVDKCALSGGNAVDNVGNLGVDGAVEASSLPVDSVDNHTELADIDPIALANAAILEDLELESKETTYKDATAELLAML